MPFGLINRHPSISLRIAFFFCATFAIALASAFVFTYVQLSYSLRTSSKDVISAKFHETAIILRDQGVTGLRRFLSKENHRILNAPYMIRVYTRTGETLYVKPSVQEKTFDFDESFQGEINPEKLVGWHSLSAKNDEDKFEMRTEQVGDYYLQVGKSDEELNGVLERVSAAFKVTGVLFIILSGGIGIWYSKSSLAPIRHLVSTIQGIEKGDLTQRVALGRTKDELYDLGDTFNRMIDRIEKLIRVMRESLDNVAHDIRTPLTRIRAVAEDAILSSSPESFKEALEDCAESSTNISELVDQLLNISEADAGTLILHYDICDVKILFAEVVEIYEFVAQEKNVTIEITPFPNQLVWKVDRKRIKQVIGNLLDNAIKFSPDHTKILITAETDGQHLLKIDVKDNGCGIPESDLSRIWDRLFRGDKSRSTKGLGLGLSIVRSIVTAHGGNVDARPGPDGGMTFSVHLPYL